VSRLGTASPESHKLWQKLTKGPESGFLDTVAEAALVIHFLDVGLSVSLERPFDPSVSNSKDADIVVTLNGVERWLDVLNVEIASFDPPTSSPFAPFIALPTPTELTDTFAARAKKKYENKFKQAIRSGPLKGSSVGILLSIFKSEKAVILQLLNGVKLPFPDRLFSDKNPGLDLVYIYTFRSDQESDLMRPIPVAEWKRV
jgi:hypothetical protein